MKLRLTLFLSICVLLSATVHAQLSSEQVDAIDALFEQWNAPNHPGGSVGVMQDGKVVYSKAYGLASLEYLVPNTTGTIYNTASVSKQFTAMGIVRLEEQGKLSVDDDIRKHVPGLPDFGETITIRHMLHHTSGLRSLHALLGLAGWRGDDTRTNEDLNRLLLKQTDLNFKPGDEYLYCNTGFMLMATIIENITEEKFADWMLENVFLPLGMTDTYVEDQYNRVVPNNATSYDLDGDQFIREVEYWGYVGSGNMHATTDDLLTWLQGFNSPPAGWEASFQRMLTLDPFNDGTPNNYAFGVSLSEDMGRKRIGHGGSIGGFRSVVGTYPDERLSIAILTNFSRGNPGGKARDIAAILFDADQDVEQASAKIKSRKVSAADLGAYKGSFWDARAKLSRKLYVRDDTLRYARSQFNESPLIPVADDVFQMLGTDAKVEVRLDTKRTPRTMTVLVDGASPSLMTEYQETEETSDELKSYVGRYYSPEVETAYAISIEGDKVSGYHPRHGWIGLVRKSKDILEGDWPLNTIEVQRNEQGDVQGIMVTNGRVRNMWFEKE